MRTKIGLVSILIIATVIGSGCLNLKGEIKPEQVQVKEFKWTSFNTYQMVINSDFDGEAVITVYFAPEISRITLMKGENLIKGYYGNYTQFLTRKQGQLTLKMGYHEGIGNIYENSISKVIDMPYVSFDVIPSSPIIGKDGGYLSVSNNGNIEGNIRIEKDMWSCGVRFTNYGWLIDTILKPQEFKQIPIELEIKNKDCVLKQEEAGITTFKMSYLVYPNKINLDEIGIKYRNS